MSRVGKYLLAEVDDYHISHARFLAWFLHLDNRVIRIRYDGDSNLSTKVFGINEQLCAIYHEFIQRLKDLRERRRRAIPMRNFEQNNLNDTQTLFTHGDSAHISDEKIHSTTNANATTNARYLTPMKTFRMRI